MRHDVIRRPAMAFGTTLIAVAMGLSACSSDSKTSSSTTGAPSAATTAGAVDATSAAGSVGTGGEAVVTGTLVSSGAYEATWAWQPGNAADPGTGGITVTSDKQTYGNIQVLADGSITFTTGAPEISAGQPFTGSGARVQITNDAPCSFTLDNDVTGSDGTVLHLKGGLTLKGGAFC